ncbi:MAG: 4-alpha-glucanotransferase, partial [Cyanobacteriota bacterium]
MITSVSSSQQVYSLDSKRSKQVSFGRKLKQDEQAGYQKAVQNALKELDKQNLSIIAHGPSFPSLSSEDTGIGSPYTSGGVKFMEFLNKLGFNSVQLGPSGKTKSSDASPYTSTVFSDNTLFIDLNALTKPEWAGILSEETFNTIVANNEAKDTGRVSYEYAYDKQDAALQEAWSNFKAKVDKLPELSGSDASKISELQEKFDSFKESNKLWLESDARYEALAKANGNDYWGVWNDLDKNLTKMLSSKDKTEQEKAQARLKELETDPKLSDEMEYYKFCQFVMSQQKADIVKKVPVKTIADIQVTYSDRDWWALQNVFMNDQRLGVPPDYFSKDGQAWGFPAIDPDKLFVKDAAGNIKKENGIPVLGEGGQLIKTRFDKMFRDNPGGVRIDHIVGLIDPWVYPATAKTAKV